MNDSAIERTLVMFKPDHVKLADRILEDLASQDAQCVQTVRVDAVPQAVIEAHYAPHQDKDFFGYMTKAFVGKPVVLAIFKGPDIIERLRERIGHRDPRKAAPGTIRHDYSTDSSYARWACGRSTLRTAKNDRVILAITTMVK